MNADSESEFLSPLLLRCLIPLIFLVICFSWATPSFAQDELPTFSNEDCAKCHARFNPNPPPKEEGTPLTMPFVNWTKFKASIHFQRGLHCKDCHAGGYEHYPHKGGDRPSCMDCHGGVQAAFDAIKASKQKSAHSEDLACKDCHVTHDVKPAVEQSLVEKDSGCIHCHRGMDEDDPQSMKKTHAWHPQAGLHLNRIPCIVCHTQPEEGNPGFSHRILGKEEATKNCRDCHSPDGKMVFYISRMGHAPDLTKSEQDLMHHFYISGSTRSDLIDLLGLGLLLISFIGVLLHGSIRFATRKVRQ